MGSYSKQNKTKTYFTAAVEERSQQDENAACFARMASRHLVHLPASGKPSFLVSVSPSLRVSSGYQAG